MLYILLSFTDRSIKTHVPSDHVDGLDFFVDEGNANPLCSQWKTSSLSHAGHQHGHQQWVLTYLLRESQFRCKIPVWDILLYYSNSIIMFALQKINISIWTEYLIVYKMYAYTCTWVVMFQVFTSCSTRKKQEWAQCLLFSKLTTKKSQINLIIINTRIYLAAFF